MSNKKKTVVGGMADPHSDMRVAVGEGEDRQELVIPADVIRHGIAHGLDGRPFAVMMVCEWEGETEYHLCSHHSTEEAAADAMNSLSGLPIVLDKRMGYKSTITLNFIPCRDEDEAKKRMAAFEQPPKDTAQPDLKSVEKTASSEAFLSAIKRGGGTTH